MAIDVKPLEETEQELVPFEEPGPDDKPRVHYVNPPDNPHISRGFPDMEGPEVVQIARANGIEIVALCGYRWVPKFNPDHISEVCEKCSKIAGDILRSELE